MIGNDIVDLKQAAKDSNWRRPRFLDKVFTQKEQEFIRLSEDQHQMVWLLWSMKEAAYKIHVQQYRRRFFNPKKLECTIDFDDKGKVKIDKEVYYTNSIFTEDYIYTIANRDLNQEVNSSVFKSEIAIYKVQSDTLKQQVLKSISETQNIELNLLNIKKTDLGIPEIFHNSKKLPIDFSLTHCGNYCGYSILNT
jgi:phosphopantetheine--protein transferase-like protein